MAAPHVSGIYALMKSAQPSLTPDRFFTLLMNGDLTQAPANRTEYGENRWSPAVRELRPDVFCGRSERQSVTCVLEPGGLRNELSFKDGDLGCDRRKSPAVSLHRFRYVLGSRVGEQFPVFEINGENEVVWMYEPELHQEAASTAAPFFKSVFRSTDGTIYGR